MDIPKQSGTKNRIAPETISTLIGSTPLESQLLHCEQLCLPKFSF